jgi:NADPH:quinone reductase-like Zn-dependent oxidoreductase
VGVKAIMTEKYGDVDVLRLQETERPSIRENEILVRVYAFSINPVDWKIRKGDLKLLVGRRPPKILGGDYAGVVAEVGKQITNFKIGDEVFGMVNAFKGGTYAEFVRVKKEEIAPKPQNLNFEEAASLPLVSLTAYQALVDKGNMHPGHHVMINGCSGGVGLSALQISKALESRVTGVCSAKNFELVKKMGADHIIDYTNEDVLQEKNAYDIFFDAVGNQSFSQVKETLRPHGIYVTTLPSFQSMILGPLINLLGSKKFKKLLVSPRSKDLAALKEMAENGKLVPVLEKVYSMDQVREAHSQSETGRVVGKVVVKVV